MSLEGNVEAEFLYSTLLSTGLVPFGHLPFRTVVLPILWTPEGYKMLTAKEAREQGYLGLAEWLEKCEEIWKEKRGDKAEKETTYSWLDYRKKLTQQRRKRHTVVYPDVNRVMFGSVLDGGEGFSGTEQPTGKRSLFFVESAMYYADTDDKEEAFYIASWLNSPIIDQMLQSFRRKEQGGHPHVHKRVWEFPISSYKPSSPQHRKMALLGEECAATVEKILMPVSSKGDRVGLMSLRNRIREVLSGKIQRLDGLARELLDS